GLRPEARIQAHGDGRLHQQRGADPQPPDAEAAQRDEGLPGGHRQGLYGESLRRVAPQQDADQARGGADREDREGRRLERVRDPLRRPAGGAEAERDADDRLHRRGQDAGAGGPDRPADPWRREVAGVLPQHHDRRTAGEEIVARNGGQEPGAQFAAASGLRYVRDGGPGFRRRGASPKTFAYDDARGRRITDPATLRRIRSLGIPPAWKEVWICPHAGGHIQATGIDARGRKQYRYHPHWRAARDETKFHRTIAFGKAL